MLLDVTPRGLGIAVVGGYADTIIERNAQIPVEQTRTFTTSQDGQQPGADPGLPGRSTACSTKTRSWASCCSTGCATRRGARCISQVTFEIDTDGILQVRALDTETQREQRARIKVLGTSSEEQNEALAAKHEDMPAPVDQQMD